jgi:DNA-binding transcriptional regulator/RsmH inhibitor MraZ
MRKKATVSKKATMKGRITSPAEYRQFAVESVQRCIAAPNRNRRRKAVHLMMAQAWAKLADQAEEWRMHHPRQQRHRAA